MSTHDWRCPRCRKPLGRMTTLRDWRRRDRLTLSQHVASTDRVGTCWVIVCECGGRRTASSDIDIRMPPSHLLS